MIMFWLVSVVAGDWVAIVSGVVAGDAGLVVVIWGVEVPGVCTDGVEEMPVFTGGVVPVLLHPVSNMTKLARPEPSKINKPTNLDLFIIANQFFNILVEAV